MFTPSKYQLAVFNEVENGNTDIVVEATAGSGKSTTLVEVTKRIQTRGLLLAFNKHIVQAIQPKVARNITVKTIHAVGYGCVREFIRGLQSPNDNKYREISKAYANQVIQKANNFQLEPFKIAKEINNVSRFARLTLTDPNSVDDLKRMIGQFALEVTEQELILPIIGQVIADGDLLAKTRGEIDFTDMLWLPHSFKLNPSAYPVVLVDEAQDLNSAQLELVIKCCNGRGRKVFVGDRFQAIMAFAGSNSDSMDRIIERTNAKTLPLSICYRCPTSHIKLAKEFSPNIEPAPGAIEGEVKYISELELANSVEVGDLVLCRMTAPLIRVCLELIAKQVPAQVKGVDVAKQLIDVINDVAKMPGFDYRLFEKFLEDYSRDKAMKLSVNEDSTLILTAFLDKVDGVRYCYQWFKSRTIDWLCQDIDRLFSDRNSEDCVILSTIHRSKGLENDTVFILYPEKLPLTWKNQKPSELDQEYNICFVAHTRAKKTLFMVRQCDKPSSSVSNSVSRFEIGEIDDDF